MVDPSTSPHNSTNTATGTGVNTGKPPHQPSIDTLITFNQPIHVRLTEANYHSWKAQVLPVFYAYNLFSHIDAAPPPTTVLDSSGHSSFNPDYISWHRQDQFLISWLRSSLTETVLASTSSAATARDLWRLLEEFFSSNTRARIIDLKRQLQTIKKGDLSLSAYLLHIRTISDKLASSGYLVPDDELVSYAINGLGTEYSSIIAAVVSAQCSGPFSFSTLRSILTSHESITQSFSSTSNSAFYASSKGGANKGYKVSQTYNSTNTRPNSNFPNSKGCSLIFDGSQPSMQQLLLDIESRRRRWILPTG